MLTNWISLISDISAVKQASFVAPGHICIIHMQDCRKHTTAQLNR